MPQLDTLQPYQPIADTLAADSTLVADSVGCGSQYLSIYDSLFTPIDASQIPLHKSLFTHHHLQAQNQHEIAINHAGTSGWYLGVIALSICLLCIYLRAKQIDLVRLLQSAIDHRAMDRMLRDTNLTHAIDQSPIALIMLIPAALIGFHYLNPITDNVFSSLLQYLILLLGCYAVYFFRNGIVRLLGIAFDNSESVHIYLSSNYVYHLLYAIAMTAMAFFICYTDSMGTIFLYILLGIIGLLFIFRLFRGMQLILTLSKTSKLYLFYYLCILEIVPIVVITKLAISY